MSTATATPALTTADLFDLPDDGIDRVIIRGELRERPVTRRNRWHSRVMAKLVFFLENWLSRQSGQRGQIFTGEVGIRLRRNPDTTVGADIAYVSADVIAQTPADVPWIEGPPVLAVEIVSPSDKQEDIVEKVRLYLESGVSLVWIVDPDFQTVRIHCWEQPPVLVNSEEELTAEPHLPGFRVRVADIFQN